MGNPSQDGLRGLIVGSSPLELLVLDLNEQTRVLSSYLRTNGLPDPSFERDGPIEVLPPQAPEEMRIAREKLLDNALQIFQLISGPGEYLPNAIAAHHYMEILRWMSHFGIFELVPLEGSISYSELATKAGVSAVRLKCLARMAMTNHVFAEPKPGFIAHSATSAALVENSKLRDQRVWVTSVNVPTASAMVTAHERWPDSTGPNETAFNVAFNTELPMYQYIAKQPELHKVFGRVMSGVGSSPKSDLKHLVNAFNWAGLGKATVVDIGGSMGHSCVALAKASPELELVVQDIPHVAEAGIKMVKDENEPAIAHRIRFHGYDFFTPQLVKGAAVYLFRQILHNWDSESAVKILKNTVDSMSQSSHLLIMDFVLPEPGSILSITERELRSKDVGMMQRFNAQERDLQEWRIMLEAADPRLKIMAVNKPYGSSMSVIDAVRG